MAKSASRDESKEGGKKKGCRKALRVQAAFDRRHLSFVEHKIDDIRGLLREQYGVVANPALYLWENVELQLETVDVTKFLAHQKSTACHNHLQSPAGHRNC